MNETIQNLQQDIEIYHKSPFEKKKIFAVAPMMDWTDRHCRFFHRQLTRHALLYTEMVVADAILHGDRARHLAFDACEHPLALQLGGSDPVKLSEAVQIAADFGYDEINLNVGCPSDRVQSGTFGACLMREPDLVARCVVAMKQVTSMPVTVKCRIGVDDQEPRAALWNLTKLCVDSGVDALWVHARMAWLEGLSPKENRDVPPLDYDLVYALKRDFPALFIGINGGIQNLEDTADHFKHVDGVMMGRSAYHHCDLLAGVDKMLGHSDNETLDVEAVLTVMSAYIDRHISNGGRANHITRHMVGMFGGMAGARRWRQILSVEACKPHANGQVLFEALDAMREVAA